MTTSDPNMECWPSPYSFRCRGVSRYCGAEGPVPEVKRRSPDGGRIDRFQLSSQPVIAAGGGAHLITSLGFPSSQEKCMDGRK